MESCSVVVTFESGLNPMVWHLTIQMKSLQQYFFCLLVFYNMKFGISLLIMFFTRCKTVKAGFSYIACFSF